MPEHHPSPLEKASPLEKMKACVEEEDDFEDIVNYDEGEAFDDEEDEFEIRDTVDTNPSDELFDKTVGILEDIVISTEFQAIMDEFCTKNCVTFDEGEENKLEYMVTFESWKATIEGFIESSLKAKIADFSMSSFLEQLAERGDEIIEEVLELLVSVSDFSTFKELMLARKEETSVMGSPNDPETAFETDELAEDIEKMDSLNDNLGDEDGTVSNIDAKGIIKASYKWDDLPDIVGGLGGVSIGDTAIGKSTLQKSQFDSKKNPEIAPSNTSISSTKKQKHDKSKESKKSKLTINGYNAKIYREEEEEGEERPDLDLMISRITRR